MIPDGLVLVDVSTADPRSFRKHMADCVVLTHEGKILLQHRPEGWGAFAGCLNAFGGHVEEGETVMQGLVRELKEELGADVMSQDVVFLGAVTEDFTQHTELVHIHFWHDKERTITGCYEAESRCFETAEEAMLHPKVMAYTKWALSECVARNFVR